MKLHRLFFILFLSFSLINCVQNSHLKIITVKVDMTNQENVSNVGIRGTDPLSWDETTYLSDTDGDGIYEDTFEIYTASQNVEFKFVNNDSEFELQDQDNRSLTFMFKPEVITYQAIFNNAKDITVKRKD